MTETNEFNLSSILTRTPEQIAEDGEMQTRAEQRLKTKLASSPAAANYQFAIGTEADARNWLAQADAAAQSADFHTYLKRLAESFFLQGKFNEAAAAHPDDAQKIEYERYAQALAALDAPVCDCPPIQFASLRSAKGASVPARREINSVFVAALEKEIKFIQCDRCQQLFAQSA